MQNIPLYVSDKDRVAGLSIVHSLRMKNIAITYEMVVIEGEIKKG